MPITYEPAECARDCDVPDCPYTHEESWCVGVVTFETRREAEKFAAALDATEKQLSEGLDTLAKPTT